MGNAGLSSRPALNERKVIILAQDPSVRVGGKILTAEVSIPAEDLLPGPRGYRVCVIDYDASTTTLYQPGVLTDPDPEHPLEAPDEATILGDPRFHAQNAYAIVMRTLARFEFALGRRVCWGCDGHQIHVAPHAFAEANAFYAREHRGIFFGYFQGRDGRPVFSCLSHDVIAHETTHALLDGLRSRYLEPSSPDQGAFHEGFADVVALLSILSLPAVVESLLDDGTGDRLIGADRLTSDALRRSVLMGLAEQMGQELSTGRATALRNSALLSKGRKYMSSPEFLEEHRRGELLVAAMMNALVDIWVSRIESLGFIRDGRRDLSRVVEDGARTADHLLTMAIRAIDYCPPTDITFADYLSALLTIDSEVVPDDSKFGYRKALLANFNAFDIRKANDAASDGTWRRWNRGLCYSRTRFDSMLRDREEVFRFLWENRDALEIGERGYVEVQSVRPSTRIGPDGFVLHETVAEYVQILTLEAHELKTELSIDPPDGLPDERRLRLFGGGALIFDEYGRLKHHIANHLANSHDDRRRQTARLQHLYDIGFFDVADGVATTGFAGMHRLRCADNLEARPLEAKR